MAHADGDAQPWDAQLAALVATELEEAEHAARLDRLLAALRGARVPVLAVVTALGAHLAAPADAPRARAVAALAAVVADAPAEAVTDGDLRHLAEFFAARLADWPALRGALAGAAALLGRRAPALAPAGAAALARALADDVFVQALPAADRAAALGALAAAAASPHGAHVLAAGVNLAEYAVASIDGEKDPRALLAALRAARAVVAAYEAAPAGSAAAAALDAQRAELFDVLACYFPVAFNPPPGDARGITRAALAAELRAALAAHAGWAPLLVPLALDKLGATLRTAKDDALELLADAAPRWAGGAPGAWREHAPALWAGLRRELLAPAREGLLPADAAAAEAGAPPAARCLARLLRAAQAPGGPGPLVLLGPALAEPGVRDAFACIASPGEDAATAARGARRAKAGVGVLAAACAAGGAARDAVLAEALPQLLAAARTPGGGEGARRARRLAWTAMLQLARGCGGAEAEGAAALGGDAAALVQQVVDAALEGGEEEEMDLDGGAPRGEEEQESSGSEGDEDGADGAGTEDPWVAAIAPGGAGGAAALRLAALAALLSAPALSAAVAAARAPAVAAHLQRRALAAAPRPRREAAAALRALAAGPHAAAVREHALPALAAAAAEAEGGAAAHALAALEAVAAAGGSMRLEAVQVLDGAVQAHLPGAAAGAPRAAAAATAALLSAARIVRAAEEAADADGGSQLAPFVQFAANVVDAALLLPPDGAGAGRLGGADFAALLDGAADAVFVAARQAGRAPAQRAARLAADAAAALALLPARCDGAAPPAVALQAAVCGGALAALPPTALEAPEVWAAARALARLGCAAAFPAHGAAAAAAALLLNKSRPPPAGAAALLGEARAAAAEPANAAAAWACLAALTRGLAMRGAPEAVAQAEVLVAVLAGAGAGVPDAGAQEAARCLELALLEGAAAADSLRWPGRRSHAAARLLWGQRLYTAAAGALAAALGGGDRLPLLLGVAHVLRGAPPGALRADAARAVPWAVRCLEAILAADEGGDSSPPLAHAEELLPALAAVVEGALEGEVGREAAAEAAPRLVPALAAAARWRRGAAARGAALRCLAALPARLPYAALHPHRRGASVAAAAACDDDRRDVRREAVRARAAWARG